MLSRTLQAGIAALLVFTPLVFGSVEYRWVFVIEASVCLLILLWMSHEATRGTIGVVRTGLGWPVLFLLVYLLITLLPLPPLILHVLSPAGKALYQAASDARAAHGIETDGWFPISLAPFETSGELIQITALAGFFFLLIHILRLHGGYKFIYALLIAFGTAMAVFGVAQDIWSKGKIYGKYDSASGSPFGPFVNHNHFAGYLEMTLGLALGMFAAEAQRLTENSGIKGGLRHLAWIRNPHGAKCWILLVTILLMLLGVAASFSRGGALSVAGASALFALGAFLPAKRSRGTEAPRRHRRLIVVALAAVVLVLGALALSPKGLARWGRIYDDAASYRLDVWRDSIGAIRDFAPAGAGLGAFRSLYPRYKTGHFHSETTHAENEYIQWLVETGTIGLLLLSFVGFAFARKMARSLAGRKDPYFRSLAYGSLFGIVALSIHNLVDFNLHVPSNALAFVTLAALSLLSVSIHHGRHGESLLLEVNQYPVRSIKGAALLCAALAITATAGYSSWARYQSLRLEDEWVRNKLFLPETDPGESRFALLRRSLEWSGWNDRAHILEAEAYESASSGQGLIQLFKSRQFLEEARRTTLEAIRLRPIQARYWAALGRLETAMLNEELAERAFQQALRLAPTSGAIHRDYGMSLLFQRKDREGAARLILARNYGPNIHLRDLLETLASYSKDLELWRTLVRYNPEDLRIYADFLASRGFSREASEMLRQAEALERKAGSPTR